MILQLFIGTGGITDILANVGNVIAPIAGAVGKAALGVGTQYVQGLVNKELNRSSQNDAIDSLKAAIRAASNVVSPVVAPGQRAVYSGGPATGSAFLPSTVLPPSISPPAQILQINPEFSRVSKSRDTVTTSAGQPVRTGAALTAGSLSVPFFPGAPPGFAGGALRAAGGAIARGVRGMLGRAGRVAREFDPRTPIGRRMLGAAAGAAAVEAGAELALEQVFPGPPTAFAPGRGFSILAESGAPLRITEGPMPNGLVAPTPTGLPARGRFQREANGVNVQWYFWDGSQMTPVDRRWAMQCAKKECIYRLDVFSGKFLRLGRRRMNPMNVSAAFRAGRRLDSAERLMRKIFSVQTRQKKTGKFRRKARKRKKA